MRSYDFDLGFVFLFILIVVGLPLARAGFTKPHAPTVCFGLTFLFFFERFPFLVCARDGDGDADDADDDDDADVAADALPVETALVVCCGASSPSMTNRGKMGLMRSREVNSLIVN
jgi:hypothetical protein